MKLALNLLGMFILGAAALAAFTWITEWRVTHGQRIESASAGSSRDVPPAQALAEGIRAALATTERSLDGDRGIAITALDGAVRAARLGTEAASGGFGRTYELVMRARHALQNGDAAGARQRIAQAREALDVADARRLPPPVLQDYVGATVIDAEGARIGEVLSFAERQGGIKARLRIGGVSDAAGFIDAGGRELWIAPESLLFGRPRRLGATLVGAPSA